MTWIDVNQQLPTAEPDKDYSPNVWATNGRWIYVMHVLYTDDGWMWANCYGNVFSDDGDIDDDYGITHWQPISIPELPPNHQAPP
jgi:hypothetical protein